MGWAVAERMAGGDASHVLAGAARSPPVTAPEIMSPLLGDSP
jgi:hypothetical protein